jgi:hypothetical protein
MFWLRHIVLPSVLNKEVGVGLTITVWVVTAEEQPLAIICRVIVLFPGVAQLTLCGPAPLGGAPKELHPWQFQLKLLPAGALPLKVKVVLAFWQILVGLAVKFEVGKALTVTS